MINLEPKFCQMFVKGSCGRTALPIMVPQARVPELFDERKESGCPCNGEPYWTILEAKSCYQFAFPVLATQSRKSRSSLAVHIGASIAVMCPSPFMTTCRTSGISLAISSLGFRKT